MKTTEQRLEELEAMVSALAILSVGATAAAIGDGAVPLIRTLAEKSPDLSAEVRKVLHRIADAVEGRQEASHA